MKRGWEKNQTHGTKVGESEMHQKATQTRERRIRRCPRWSFRLSVRTNRAIDPFWRALGARVASPKKIKLNCDDDILLVVVVVARLLRPAASNWPTAHDSINISRTYGDIQKTIQSLAEKRVSKDSARTGDVGARTRRMMVVFVNPILMRYCFALCLAECSHIFPNVSIVRAHRTNRSLWRAHTANVSAPVFNYFNVDEGRSPRCPSVVLQLG